MTNKVVIYSLGIAFSAMNATWAQSPSPASGSNSVPVNVDNFARAESDLYMGNAVKDAGGTGKFFHHREMMPIERQTVIRPNRDTLYSPAVFDLEGGPVKVTLPDARKRFRSMQVINEDHYVIGNVEYKAGSYTYDKKKVGTRYVLIAVRTLVDPNDPKDMEQVHALQDGIRASQKSPGSFDVPNWDQASQKKIREALLVLAQFTGGFKNAFGAKGQVEPVRHLIGTAAGVGWQSRQRRDLSQLHAGQE